MNVKHPVVYHSGHTGRYIVSQTLIFSDIGHESGTEITAQQGMLLLIPRMMIGELIDERESNAQGATDEIAKKWGTAQCIAGPAIFLPAKYEGKTKLSEDLVLFPETFNLKGDINSQTLHRGIYDVAVYNAPLSLEGVFCMTKELKDNLALDKFQLDHAKYMFYIRDLRGLSKNVEITAGQQKEILLSNCRR